MYFPNNFPHLNDSLSGIKFGIDADGNYGYYKDGADTVTPFRNPDDYRIIDLGVGTTFDISSLVPNVDTTALTVDDFYLSTNSSVTGAETGASLPNKNIGLRAYILQPTKTYSNGILKWSLNSKAEINRGEIYATSNASASVHAFLICKNVYFY